MQEAESRSCPLCDQITPRDVPQYVVRGKPFHEACAKEIAQAYINKNFSVAPKTELKKKKKKRKDHRDDRETNNMETDKTEEKNSNPQKQDGARIRRSQSS